MDKFDIQDNEYSFPYHYITSIEKGVPNINKRLSWGIEYLTYIEFIKEEIRKINPKSFLDIGCGDGYLINSFDFNPEKKYLGIDLSTRAIKFANAFSKGYSFEELDLFQIQEKFQLVTLIEVIEHIPDDFLENFINESFNKVEINGYLIISVPTTVEKVHKKHYRHYDEVMLNDQIKRDDFIVLDEFRIYKKSFILEELIKFCIGSRSKTLKKWFWDFHKKNFFMADKSNGKHLIRIYKKVK